MNKTNHSLSNVFDVEAVEVTDTSLPVVQTVQQREEEDIKDDFELTKSNLKSLLAQGESALEHAIEVAKSSEHPRAFEVVSNMIKQLADVNEQLLNLYNKKKQLEKVEDKNQANSAQTINNTAVFVGSTSELNRILENMNKDKQ